MAVPELITVEEAASRLDLSIATIRRRCSTGELVATKIGRNWLIDPVSLPSPVRRATRRRASASAAIDFRVSLRHLRTQDLARDLWVPDILNHADDLADPQRLISAAASRADLREPFDPPTIVPVPKSPIFQRNATNLALPDRLAYHGVVLSMAPRMAKHLHSGVFSARPSGRKDRFLEPGTAAWVRWKSAVEMRLREHGGWMAETDITSFFDCIHHTILMQDLEGLGTDPVIRAALREMLRFWSVTPNTGIPQGPDASRVLANFYMHPIDDVMSTVPEVCYFRYMDDIRITSASRHAVIGALKILDVECRRRNLYLSTKKTSLLAADKAIASLSDDQIDRAKYVYDHSNDPKEVRKQLKKLFRTAMTDEVDTRRAKFSIYRLRALRDRGVLALVLSRVEDLAPLGWLVPAYILPWLRREKVAEGLSQFLHDPERNTSDYLSTWLLAALLDEPRAVTADILRYARDVATNAGAPSYHRAVAMNVVALVRNRRDLDRLRDVVAKEFDPELVRAALVALKRAGALDKAVEQRARRIDGIDGTLAYLRGRTTLPSLIFVTVQNTIR